MPLERFATAPILAVVGFLAPGSLTSRHAVSPTKNSTRSQWRAQHGVTIEWSSLRVGFHSDNQAVVSSLRKGSCRCSNVMSLLHRLYLVAALQNFSVSASYVEGVANGIADSLSRQDFDRFRTLAPQAAAISDMTRPLPSILGEPSLGAVYFYTQQPLAPAIRRLYAVGQCHYHMFCSMHRRRPLPAIEIYQRASAPTMASTNHHFFEHKNGEAPSQAHLTSVVQRLLERDGCPYAAAFKGHSYRSGTATTAAEAVVPDWPIRTMGRWASDTHPTYIKTPQTALLNVAPTPTRRT